ncbi:MAG: DNA polymerase I [Candidatus Omnitrophica bacterium CG23_combo_of_CG06-09_8_20_14_all_41_10]|uniref:DNA polymerase I n=1 Tax=Candidatus Sherwoodlollariibacterium unditelluris TaxID=1974757 RepID=A0A2G9YN83_9BACT|nr:MAG: DNA polymerase I [Candidatus Omnitrophica bacterium CG23_combo_of_CG06-09_8_20_14_all_41_10]
MDSKRLYLLDATAFCYRAFYAVRGLSTSFGQPTGAIYGFLNILNKIIKENKPGYLAVCFDVSRNTFRSKKFAEYKVQRPPMPDDLSLQIPLIKEIVAAYGFLIAEKEGFEADDVIATFTKRAKALKMPVTIVSSDKDILQLVSDGVEVFSPYKDTGITYDENMVVERFGVKPNQVVDVLSLMGDSADNIPGIPGIGKKTAVGLIREFGSVVNLLEDVDKIEKEKLRQAVKENEDKIRLNKELIVLAEDMDIGFDLKCLKIGSPDLVKLASLFKRLEFKKFMADLKLEKGNRPNIEVEGCRDRDLSGIFEANEELFICADSWDNLVFYSKGKIFHPDKIEANFKHILSDCQIKKVGHGLKKMKIMLAKNGVLMEGLYFDTMIAAYLLNPSQPEYSLDSLALKYLDKAPQGNARNAQEALSLIKELKPKLEGELKTKSLFKLFTDIEMPLANVLSEMELCGVNLDLKLLLSLSQDLEKRLNKLTRAIYDLSGSEFNINSPKQLRVVLFDNLKLPVVKKTKTGPSTDEEVLNRLATKHKLPALLLEYRRLAKLKTTYVDALPQLVDSKTGKVHTSFNQCATETGRLSSSNPNLQNIPVKTDIGSNIRRAIIASSKENLLISCDYSQIELRILAHLSKDENLISEFKADRDIHKATASLIYGIEEKEVSDEMRDTAKRVNFGIVYGLTSYGLSRDLNIPLDKAQAFIEAYFSHYPKVKDYIEDEIRKAQKDGFVTTILGRRRYIPEIKSENMAIRQFAQRQAVNTHIQGSAADLIKLAMINIYKEIKERGLKSEMVLQIHDELLFDLPKEELSILVNLARERMENVLKLDVPVKVDIKIGKNWLEMDPAPVHRRGVEEI